MHTRAMELRSIGGYTLVEPLSIQRSTAQFYLTRSLGDPEDGPPRFLAKLHAPGRGPNEDVLRAQFEHETRLLRACNHPCIPSIHAAGEQDGIAFIIMDYVDGVDLATLLGHRSGEPRALSKEIAVYILGQLADAVRHMHELQVGGDDEEPTPLGVLHRDICPANIFLSRQGDVVLGDLGAATSGWLHPDYDMRDAGTKAYMAPERITGSSTATAQSDLFSLAVVLWEILRGERCFAGDDEIATLDAIARFDINHSSRRVSGLSSKLSEIVRKNLDRDPARRYSGAYQMLQRLSQAPEAKVAETSRAELAALVSRVAS